MAKNRQIDTSDFPPGEEMVELLERPKVKARKKAVKKYGEKIVQATQDIWDYIEGRGDYDPISLDVIAKIIVKVVEEVSNGTDKKKISRVRSQARRHSK